MKIAATVAQYLLGLMFVVFGANGFLHFIPQPPPPSAAAAEFLAGLTHPPFAVGVFGLQVVCGLLLLAGRYIPLAIAFLSPVLVNILLYHLSFEPKSIFIGLFASLLWLLVFLSVRANFAGIFQARVRGTRFGDGRVDVMSARSVLLLFLAASTFAVAGPSRVATAQTPNHAVSADSPTSPPITVLLVGRKGTVIDDVRKAVPTENIILLSALNLEEVRAAFAQHKIQAVVMGAGLDLEPRLEIIRYVFQTSTSTAVYLKDQDSGPQGMVPFLKNVLSGLRSAQGGSR